MGSGQFGTVSKGVLHTLGEDNELEEGKGVEIAVKMLLVGVTEDERVRFLQEAAIMAQFHHPNVLTILGVITAEEPVRCVLFGSSYRTFVCDFALVYKCHCSCGS